MYYIVLLYLLLYSIFIYVHFYVAYCHQFLLILLYMYVCKPFAHTQLSSHLSDFHSAISIPQDGYLTKYFNNG